MEKDPFAVPAVKKQSSEVSVETANLANLEKNGH